MFNCGVCKKPQDILKSFDDYIGDPAMQISRILLKCTRGTKCKFVLQGVCNDCVVDLLSYYESIQNAKRIRKKLIELIENKPAFINETTEWQDEFEKLIEVDSDAILDERNCQIQEITEQDIEIEDVTSIQPYSEIYEDIERQTTEVTEDYESDKDTKKEYADVHDTDTEDEADDIQKGCLECGLVFKDATSWKMHKREKHRQGFMCDQCGKKLLTRDGLAMHLKTHDPDKQLSCTICGKRYHFEIHLKNHMAWHTGEKPYECKICSKRFVNYGLLSNHKVIHKEMPVGIECSICFKKFRQKCRLKQHMITHSKDKPYSCGYCTHRFASKYHLTTHLKYNKKCSQLLKTDNIIEGPKEFFVIGEN